MRVAFVVLAGFAMLCLGELAQADVFNMGSGFTSLETVAVGDAGNSADYRKTYGYAYGSVDYDYSIGKYEVTNAQYCDFLNCKAKTDEYGLFAGSGIAAIRRSGSLGNYSYTVTTKWANNPIVCISFWDACRFANWLNNGQGSGDTETGAYTLNGFNFFGGGDIYRNSNWQWAIASVDEWYKAAYYKGGGYNAGYWAYPNQSDTIPSSIDYRSTYGTVGQGGRAADWNDTIYIDSYSDYLRGLSTGGGNDLGYLNYQWYGGYALPTEESGGIGFRVVSSAVPESSSIIALLGGLAGLLGIGRRRG